MERAGSANGRNILIKGESTHPKLLLWNFHNVGEGNWRFIFNAGLDDGPQRSTSVLCSFSFNLFFSSSTHRPDMTFAVDWALNNNVIIYRSIYHLLFNVQTTRQHFWQLSAQTHLQLARHHVQVSVQLLWNSLAAQNLRESSSKETFN